jgi:hypothetical protein
MKKTGNITPVFADRCKEYSDAKIALRPSCLYTERFLFGAFFVTTQCLNNSVKFRVRFDNYKVILN